MSIISTLGNASSETGARWAPWPREPHEPADRVGVGCGCLCHRADCPADYPACGGVATGTDAAERLRAKVSEPVPCLHTGSLTGAWSPSRTVQG